MDDKDAVLLMHRIRKTFPGVVALDDVDFRLLPGEVHALMGENGAGKSTLIKVLTGVYPVDGGTITLAGEPFAAAGPRDAQRAGISTVYQEVNLCPNLSVAENVFAGREPRRFARIDRAAMRRRTRDLLADLDLEVDPSSLLGSHPIAVQQMVAIARAVDIEARVLILDEPTSSLDADEVAQLFRVIRRLRDQGVAILFVSHFLDQVYEIADRLTVLRNGHLVGEYPVGELDQMQLVNLMIGRQLKILEQLEERPARAMTDLSERPVVAAAEKLGRMGAIEPFDLEVHEGEVLGLAGLLGSGRTETVRLFFGADHADSGSLRMGGASDAPRTPVAGIDRGVAYCSEDRKAEGILPQLTVRENIVIALQASRGWLRRLPRRKQDEIVQEYIEALDIRPPDPEMIAGNLSGGNQQKVLLARWLATNPKLLILDEPTRGIDVGAKAEIQQRVAELARDGMSVLFVSAELDEVLRLSDRVAVLRDRRVVADLPNTGLTQESVMELIARGEAS